MPRLRRARCIAGDYPRKPRGGLLGRRGARRSTAGSACAAAARDAAIAPRLRRFGSSAGACTSAPSSSWPARSRWRDRRGERGRARRRAFRRARRADGCAGGAARSRRRAPFVELSARLVPAPDRRRAARLAARAARRAIRPRASRSCWRGWRRSRRRAAPDGSRLVRGRDVAAPRAAAFAQKMALPLFFPSA